MSETVVVGATAPGVIDPFRVATWPAECQRRHRLRRALHELLPDPRYRIVLGARPDGSIGIRIDPAEMVTNDALAFLREYREELITHETWLELIDEEAEIAGPVDPWKRR